jgi:ribonuclease P protein component
MEESSKFTRRRRLSLKKDFDAVFSGGKSAADTNLVIYVLHTERGFTRLGMAVGKKHGGAVVRNRIKRLIREAFRLNLDKLPDSSDIVVVPRQGAGLKLLEIAGSLVKISQSAARQVQ